jgi:hypothetical protein
MSVGVITAGRLPNRKPLKKGPYYDPTPKVDEDVTTRSRA